MAAVSCAARSAQYREDGIQHALRALMRQEHLAGVVTQFRGALRPIHRVPTASSRERQHTTDASMERIQIGQAHATKLSAWGLPR